MWNLLASEIAINHKRNLGICDELFSTSFPTTYIYDYYCCFSSYHYMLTGSSGGKPILATYSDQYISMASQISYYSYTLTPISVSFSYIYLFALLQYNGAYAIIVKFYYYGAFLTSSTFSFSMKNNCIDKSQCYMSVFNQEPSVYSQYLDALISTSWTGNVYATFNTSDLSLKNANYNSIQSGNIYGYRISGLQLRNSNKIAVFFTSDCNYSPYINKIFLQVVNSTDTVSFMQIANGYYSIKMVGIGTGSGYNEAVLASFYYISGLAYVSYARINATLASSDPTIVYAYSTTVNLRNSGEFDVFLTSTDMYISCTPTTGNTVTIQASLSSGVMTAVLQHSVTRPYYFVSTFSSLLYYMMLSGTTLYRVQFNFDYPTKSCLTIGATSINSTYTTADISSIFLSNASKIPRLNNYTSSIRNNMNLNSTTPTSNSSFSSLVESSTCGTYTFNGTNPVATLSVECGLSTPQTNSIYSQIYNSYQATCTINPTIPKALTGISGNYYFNNSTDITQNISWATNSGFTIYATNVSCSLAHQTVTVIGTNSVSYASGLTYNLNFYITYPPPVIAITAVQQTTTALNSNIVYNIKSLFKNVDNTACTIQTPTQSNGSALPSWITFDGTNLNIATTTIANIQVLVTAVGYDSLTISQSFNVAITNNAPSIISSLGSVSIYENKTSTITKDMSTVFKEVDPNQSLSYTISNIPSFLTYTQTGSQFLMNCNPAYSNIGSYSIVFKANDTFTTTSSSFTIVVIENKPPTAPSCSNIYTTETTGGTYTVPVFNDPEGDPVTYSVTFANGSALTSSWITFDAVTRVLVYHSPSSISSPLQLLILAADAYNPPTTVTINYYTDFAPKDNPSIAMRTGNFICFSTSSMTLSKTILTDEDSTLSYTITYANGTAAPSWLIIKLPSQSSSGNFEFSGSYSVFENVLYSFKITATDSKGQQGSAVFYIQTKMMCNSNCNTCFGPNVDQCTDCYSGRYLYISLCGLTCPTGYYPRSSDNTCQICDNSCLSCTGPTNADCTACNKNSTITYFSYKGTCVNPCPSRYYGNVINQECTSCHSYCTECYGGLSTQCTQCNIPNRYVYVSPDTCQYLECPSLTYYNTSTYDCRDCNSLCKDCYGQNSDNCITCPYSRFMASDNSCKTCDQINAGLKFEPLTNTCLEKCGKGFNLGFLECDDGNLINGDGCSSKCAVELNWKCSGGNSTTKDTCSFIVKPVCEFSYISSTSYVGTIAFSETITFNELKSEDIQITIDGPLSPYTFEYLIDNSTGFVTGQKGNKFGIRFTFKSSLMGSYQETITVKFLNEKIVQDVYGNYLGTSLVTKQIPFFLVVMSASEQQTASSQSTASLVSMLVTFGTSTLISVLMGGTIEATWLLLGTVQLMSFVPLLNMNLPSNFREFSKNLAMLNGEPQSLPNLFEYVISSDNQKPYNNYFELMNFKTNILVLNSGRKIEIWLIMICFMGVSFILYDLIGEFGKIGKIIRFFDLKLRYGMLIRAITQAYLSFTLSSILNMYTISWSGNNISYTQNIVAILGMLAVLLIPVKCFNIIYQAPNLDDPQFKKRYKTFIADLKTNDSLSYQFLSVFFFRRAAYASLYVLFTAYPLVQVGFALATTLAMFLYIVIIRPYASVLSIFLSILNEVLLFVLILPSARFSNPAISPDLSSQLGTMMVGIIAFTIFINWVSIVVYGILKYIIKKVNAKRIKRMRDIQNKIDNVEWVKGDFSKITHCKVIENK